MPWLSLVVILWLLTRTIGIIIFDPTCLPGFSIAFYMAGFIKVPVAKRVQMPGRLRKG